MQGKHEMSLTICRKCEKIFPSGSANCPYCGAPIAKEAKPDEKKGVTNVVVGLIMLACLMFLLVLNTTKKNDPQSAFQQNCTASNCPAGTRAMTASSEQEPYYTCKSRELSDYANYVMGLMLDQVNFAGSSPKITSKTGEPDVPKSQQAILDDYRTKAGVSTFEGALAKCYRGIGNMSVSVLENPSVGDSMRVRSESNPNETFWLPRAKLNLRD